MTWVVRIRAGARPAQHQGLLVTFSLKDDKTSCLADGGRTVHRPFTATATATAGVGASAAAAGPSW